MGVFEPDRTFERAGKALGYIFSYFLFTTILFFIFILDFSGRIGSWGYPYIMAITFAISLIGIGLKRLLK